MDLNQVTLPAVDMEASITFYQKLGLKLIVHTHPRYARFECPNGNSTFSLHTVDERPVSSGTSIYFECDNLDEHVAALVEKGLVFDEMPEDKSYLWREARLEDPCGNGIVLFFAGENRKNPPWRKSDT